MKLWKPSEEDLKPLIDEALADHSAADYTAHMVGALSQVLADDPLQYRSFGPYWWLVKQAMIAAGIGAFGDHLDAKYIEAMDYGKPHVNLVAAWAYQAGRFDAQAIYGHVHVLDAVNDDGEPDTAEYVLVDEDIEGRAATATN